MSLQQLAQEPAVDNYGLTTREFQRICKSGEKILDKLRDKDDAKESVFTIALVEAVLVLAEKAQLVTGVPLASPSLPSSSSSVKRSRPLEDDDNDSGNDDEGVSGVLKKKKIGALATAPISAKKKKKKAKARHVAVNCPGMYWRDTVGFKAKYAAYVKGREGDNSSSSSSSSGNRGRKPKKLMSACKYREPNPRTYSGPKQEKLCNWCGGSYQRDKMKGLVR